MNVLNYMKLVIKKIKYMKKLKEELFINAEQIYDKNSIDKFRQKIYDIG